MDKTVPTSLFINFRCRLCARQKPCDGRMQNLAHNENSKKSLIEKLKYFGGEFYDFFGNFDNKLLPEIVCGACYDALETSHRFFLRMENAKLIFSNLGEESGQDRDEESIADTTSEYTNDPLLIEANENDIEIKEEVINKYDNDISIKINDITNEANDDTEIEQNDDVNDAREEEQNVEARNGGTLLRPKSKEIYLTAYENFIQWKNSKNTQSFSENVFLDYFNELAEKYKPPSLWSTYSMLKNTVKTKNDIDIKSYRNLTEFIKRRSDGYVGRKSKVLSMSDVEKFLKEAPDKQYLATKVALIFGVTGACGGQDLNNLTTKDIETHGEMLLVKITNTRNKIPRTFTIHGPFYEIVKKYQALRTTNAKHDRFFQNFQKGKCTAQPIGVNKFGAMPREIAKFLNLPDADDYTGHSFRRTSATLMDPKPGRSVKRKRI